MGWKATCCSRATRTSAASPTVRRPTQPALRHPKVCEKCRTRYLMNWITWFSLKVCTRILYTDVRCGHQGPLDTRGNACLYIWMRILAEYLLKLRVELCGACCTTPS